MTVTTSVPEFRARDFDNDVERLATPIDSPAEQLVEPALAADVRALLALTDPVERHRAGDIKVLEPQNDYVGDYKEFVLRPFAYPAESRFSDGTFGVLYAGLTLQTATEEVLYWLTRFFADSTFPNGSVGVKEHLTFRACTPVADLRKTSGGVESIYDPNNYTVSRIWGARLRDAHPGLWYDSVRHRGGECLGLFIPRGISNVRKHDRFEFTWDGARFTTVAQVRSLL